MQERFHQRGVRSYRGTADEVHVQLRLGYVPGRSNPRRALESPLDQDVAVFEPDTQPIGLAPDKPIPDHERQDQNYPTVVATDDHA
jgi:hypothetical protein